MNRRTLGAALAVAFALAIVSLSTVGRLRPELHTIASTAVTILTLGALIVWQRDQGDRADATPTSEEYIQGYAAGLAHQQVPEDATEDWVRGHADGWIRKPLPRRQQRRLTAV